MNACSLFISDVEQSVLSPKVQLRGLPRRCVTTKRVLGSRDGERFSKSSSGIPKDFRNLKVQLFPRRLLAADP